MTLDFSNLPHVIPYTSQDKVHVDNGESLNIAHIGQTGYKSLKLVNALLVPLLAKNLLSIS